MAEAVLLHVSDAQARASLASLQRCNTLGRLLEGTPVSLGGDIILPWLAGQPRAVVASLEPPSAAALALSTAITIEPPPLSGQSNSSHQQISPEHWASLVCAECSFDPAAVLPVVRELAAILNPRGPPGRPAGILLHGPPGCGKTFYARALARHSGAAFHIISPSDVHRRLAGDAEAALRSLLLGDESTPSAPCVIVLDELDTLLSRDAQPSSGDIVGSVSVERRLADLLIDLLKRAARSSTRRTVVIGATTRLSSLDPRALSPSIFGRVVELAQRTAADRERILASLLSRAGAADNAAALAERTHGYAAADLAALVSHGLGRCIRRDADALPTLDDFTAALAESSPAAQRSDFSVGGGRARGGPTFDDLGGLGAIAEELKAVAVYPFLARGSVEMSSRERYTRLSRLLGVEPARGILLAGPPGCGKTALAAALLRATPLPAFYADATSMRSKVVGESERQLAALFAEARAASPAVLVIDQIDLVARSRLALELSGDASSHGTSQRLTTLLLTELDGVLSERSADLPLIVVGITSRPEVIDPALLRPGRLELHLKVEAPDAVARADILRTLLKKTPVVPPLTDEDYERMAGRTAGMAGADLAAACREAALAALRKDIKAESVTREQIDDALRAVMPSLLSITF